MNISEKRKKVLILAGGALVVALAISFAVWKVSTTPKEYDFSDDIYVFRPTYLEPSPQGGIVDPEAWPLSIPLPGETGTTAEPEPEPPPVVVYPKSSQGLSRIEFNPHIGDVFRVHHDLATGNIFMAVLEEDGMRSIWRLTQDLEIEKVLEGNEREGETFLQADSHGVLYAGFAHPGLLYRSDDQGETWEEVADSIGETFWSIADDGQGTIWGALHAYNEAILYRSTDDGYTWHKWVDFHEVYPGYATPYEEGDRRFKLRHLHDVAYLDGKLFVGTGDVVRMTLMSENGGVNWREVWDEGFTAHTPLADGTGLVFGPDRLRARGVAVYRLGDENAQEVWNPVPYGYSGYTYSMLEMGGIYYAAFHTETTGVPDFEGKSGVIVSPDAQTWYPFLELGAVSSWARTDIFMAPGEDWYGYITLNGALYRFEAPIGRWFEVHEPFGG